MEWSVFIAFAVLMAGLFDILWVIKSNQPKEEGPLSRRSNPGSTSFPLP